MLVQDTEKLKQLKQEKNLAIQRQKAINALEKITLSNCVKVFENENLAPYDEVKQLGKVLTSSELENNLKKINPYLIFEYNPYDRTKKAIYFIRNNKKDFICAYENGFIPEHSVMKYKTEDVWDHTVDLLTSKDLPKSELVEDKTSPLGCKLVFDESKPRPGWKRVQIPWGELKRGWRTVLLKLLQNNLITLYDAELTFGTDDRITWAARTGKRKGLKLPF